MKEHFLKLSKVVNSLVNSLLLILAYFVGVGTTSIFGKITGKSFISLKPKRTNWTKKDKGLKLEKMY